jgi:ribonuclease D
LAGEDFNRLCDAADNGRGQEDKTPSCWRVSGAFDLSPQQAAVLQELCRYRDRVARSMNRPLFKVLNDATLLAIAQTNPKNLNDLASLPGMSGHQVERHGPRLLEAVQRGLASEPLHPPRLPRPNGHFMDRTEALRNWRKNAAIKMGVKSDVVLPRDLLSIIAEQNPHQIEDLAALLQDSPWRLQHFGAQILAVLAPMQHS